MHLKVESSPEASDQEAGVPAVVFTFLFRKMLGNNQFVSIVPSRMTYFPDPLNEVEGMCFTTVLTMIVINN